MSSNVAEVLACSKSNPEFVASNLLLIGTSKNNNIRVPGSDYDPFKAVCPASAA
jgi:hypothetical protein